MLCCEVFGVFWQDRICRLSGAASKLKMFSSEKSSEWVGEVLGFVEGALMEEVPIILQNLTAICFLVSYLLCQQHIAYSLMSYPA